MVKLSTKLSQRISRWNCASGRRGVMSSYFVVLPNIKFPKNIYYSTATPLGRNRPDTTVLHGLNKVGHHTDCVLYCHVVLSSSLWTTERGNLPTRRHRRRRRNALRLPEPRSGIDA